MNIPTASHLVTSIFNGNHSQHIYRDCKHIRYQIFNHTLHVT